VDETRFARRVDSLRQIRRRAAHDSGEHRIMGDSSSRPCSGMETATNLHDGGFAEENLRAGRIGFHLSRLHRRRSRWRAAKAIIVTPTTHQTQPTALTMQLTIPTSVVIESRLLDRTASESARRNRSRSK